MPYTSNVSGTTSAGILEALENQTAYEQAYREGRAHIASTKLRTVSSSDKMHIVMKNPVDSGVKMNLKYRWFESTAKASAIPIKYEAYANPSVIYPNIRPSANLWAGGEASAGVITFGVGNNLTPMDGQEGSDGTIGAGGIRTIVDLPFGLSPGKSVGFVISGQGILLTAIQVACSLIWYEEPLTEIDPLLTLSD